MANLKFNEAGGIDRPLKSLESAIDSLKNEKIQAVAHSFAENMRRVSAIHSLPMNFIVYSYHLMLTQTRRIPTITVIHSGMHPQNISPAPTAGPGEKMPEIIDSAAIGRTNYLPDEFFFQGHFNDALRSMIATIPGASFDDLRRGFEATLSSMIVGTWTAVEVLAGDLWETALNLHPASLSDLTGKEKPNITKTMNQRRSVDAQSRREPDSERGDQSKSLSLRVLGEFRYDLQEAMGTILRRRFSFSVLSELREAYTLAFNKNPGAILDYVYSDDVDCLAAVRNLIVHKAAKIDGPFRDWVGSDARFSQLAVGETLPIDGSLVLTLVNPIIECMSKLLQSVDGWIARN